MPSILALDTSNFTLSIALVKDGKTIAQYQNNQNFIQAEQSIVQIENLLKESNTTYQDINYFAITNGPGSFTGIRVGLTIAKMLNLMPNIQVITINSLEALAFKHANKNHTIIATIDAKLDQIFIQEFACYNQQLTTKYQPKLVYINEIEQLLPKDNYIITGNAKKFIPNLKDQNEEIIDAAILAKLAQQKIIDNEKLTHAIEPVYIKQPKISYPKKVKS